MKLTCLDLLILVYLAVGQVVQTNFIRLSGEQVDNNKRIDGARLVLSIVHATTL